MTPPRKWTDDARDLVRRLSLGSVALDTETLLELGAAAEKSIEASESFAKIERRFSRFQIAWDFDGTRRATVEINRVAGTITVRPYRRRKSYTLPLAFVAEVIASKVSKAEAITKRKARRARR